MTRTEVRRDGICDSTDCHQLGLKHYVRLTFDSNALQKHVGIQAPILSKADVPGIMPADQESTVWPCLLLG